MPGEFAGRAVHLVVESDKPLIAVPIEEGGREAVQYFVDDERTDQPPSDPTIREALGALGAWSDLDWDEMDAALDKIRHQSTPTGPIDL